MAYQLALKTSTKRLHDYSASGAARITHDETLSLSRKSPIQFFVCMFSDGKTMVIQADSSDTVASVHRKFSRSPEFDQQLNND
uniref:Uncharacterized protein n=1 Tax=Solanum lycopersicum TaxID=4081 RepID=A0A3Q7I3L3_SOLLC